MVAPGDKCIFEQLGSGCPQGAIELRDYDGRVYCAWHLPLESPQKPDIAWFQQPLRNLTERGKGQFVGITLPGHKDPGSEAHYGLYGSTTFSHCTFGERVHLNLGARDVEITDSHFLGPAVIEGAGRRFTCEDSTFAEECGFYLGSPAVTVSFRGSNFRALARFISVQVYASLDFDECTFDVAPRFENIGTLPQQTTFQQATFGVHREQEGAYRAVRLLFATNRARESEGLLYAAEKRCHRRRLTGWRNALPWLLSWLYDHTAEYGHSYGRALGSLVAVQALAVFGYAWASDDLHFFSGHFDGRVLAFSFAQLFKPFELYAAGPHATWAYGIVRDHPGGWWLRLTTIHSVASFILVALFLLALRWRFRRD